MMCHFCLKWNNEPKSVLGIDFEANIVLLRYEAGDCAVVVSIKEPSNDILKMVFNFGRIFAKNRTQPKADFESKFHIQQNGHHWKAPFMLITVVQIPASYLIPSPRYLAS